MWTTPKKNQYEIAKRKGQASMRLTCVLSWFFYSINSGQQKIYHQLHLSKYEKKTVP